MTSPLATIFPSLCAVVPFLRACPYRTVAAISSPPARLTATVPEWPRRVLPILWNGYISAPETGYFMVQNGDNGAVSAPARPLCSAFS
ncbi:hypothetical protein EDD36DRAFT_438289 [Exophiala viscosa]|uniref:Secreted protein n=1 Tax=Exophiala viscosa TaxID=2486360 RepID=A0AAN6IEY7_9EURO|nr:hypothetical protein EDD36DRAFT_438289 [Exophiala viscosa]